MDGYEDWQFVQTLGEGAYGEVKLAVSTVTKEEVAVKIVDISKGAAVATNTKKECVILNMIKGKPHQNIINFLGYKKSTKIHYIFLELAPGGELFDRIIPDEGMAPILSQRYFQQLCSGVAHLHKLGITHRDIKPENLLLDAQDNLKITDFGLSTCYRLNNKERLMERRCGTPPYTAPEVLAGKEYRACPADVWSCGIVLVTMLAGELPWDEPSDKFKEYVAWTKKRYLYSPWTKLQSLELEFLKKILIEEPTKRLTFEQITNEKWFCSEIEMPEIVPQHSAKRLKRTLSDECLPMSQPELLRNLSEISSTKMIFDTISFSQPLHPEYMIMSQLDCTQGVSQATQGVLQRLVRRMTRFIISLKITPAKDKLTNVVDKLKITCRQPTPNNFTLQTVDRRNTILSFKVQLIEMMEGNLLVDFRLSKGDGLEFKKVFQRIRKQFDDCIVKPDSKK